MVGRALREDCITLLSSLLFSRFEPVSLLLGARYTQGQGQASNDTYDTYDGSSCTSALRGGALMMLGNCAFSSKSAQTNEVGSAPAPPGFYSIKGRYG